MRTGMWLAGWAELDGIGMKLQRARHPPGIMTGPGDGSEEGRVCH